MNPTEKRIVENIVRAKDAAVVLEQFDQKAATPSEAGANAEILAAHELLNKGIEKLEDTKATIVPKPGQNPPPSK